MSVEDDEDRKVAWWVGAMGAGVTLGALAWMGHMLSNWG